MMPVEFAKTMIYDLDHFVSKHFLKKHLGDYAHNHPMILCENDTKRKEEEEDALIFCCYSCELPIEENAAFYRCTECIPISYLHKSCADHNESPKEIFHPLFHKEHPLNLFHHLDYLSETYCNCCSYPLSGPSYGCRQCNFNIHILCAQLPLQIQHHPLHPPHTLSLSLSPPSKYPHCNACMWRDDEFKGFAFVCSECDFKLDLFCIPLMPNINVGKNHIHNKLTLFDRKERSFSIFSFVLMIFNVICNACSSSITALPFLRCVECQLSYHVHCMSPVRIKTQHHVHSLMVNNLSNVDDPADDEYYCDICEKQRDPTEAVYSCFEDCEYAAHVGCAFSKEVLILNPDPLFPSYKIEDEFEFDPREVEEIEADGDQLDPLEAKAIEASRKQVTRALQKEEDEKPEDGKNSYQNKTFKEFIGSITDDELIEMRDILQTEETKLMDVREIFLNDQPANMDEAFTQLVERLDSQNQSSNLILRSFGFEQENVVQFDNYPVPKSLSPVLDALLRNHGDIGANSRLGTKMKMLVCVLVCDAAFSMLGTRVLEIKESLLFTWWNCFRLAQCAGFKVQFVIDRLKRLLPIHFAHQAKAHTNLAIAKIDEEIENLQVELEELEEMRGPKRTSRKSIFVDECLSEASALAEHNASIDLF